MTVNPVRLPMRPSGATFATGRGRSGQRAEYIGNHIEIFCGHARDPDDRRRVASGGVVTSLLAHALRSGMVDAVALSKGDYSNGKIDYRFDLVTDADRVQDYGTSVYFNIPVERHWKKIDEFPGRVAVCALPCHIAAFRRRQQEGRGLANVPLLLSLFCGHNNEPELLNFVFDQHGIDEAEVTDVRVDRSYLGGDVWVEMSDGTLRSIPFRHFNVYRGLWCFSKSMCRYCDDHLGAHADISIGDVFVPEYRNRALKHSAMVARTEAGCSLIHSALRSNVLSAEPIDTDIVFRAQKRVIVPSGDLLSRYYACRLVGYTAKRPSEGRFRLRSFMTYLMLLLNDRVSKTRWGKRLLRVIPKPLLYAYIAAIKLVNNSLGATR
jgi:coenzyme F420 hydrogenase subunit beta